MSAEAIFTVDDSPPPAITVDLTWPSRARTRRSTALILRMRKERFPAACGLFVSVVSAALCVRSTERPFSFADDAPVPACLSTFYRL